MRSETFIDEALVDVAAGRGGDGCVSFRREKFVPRGGPDGGDGGNGGDVVLVADRNLTTLLDLQLHPQARAGDGADGAGNGRAGKAGRDCVLRLPVGTVVRDADAQGDAAPLADLVEHGQQLVVARGGRGGRGNARFATSTHQAPREAEPGRAGEERTYRLELKLLADVGLVGYPNVGKSTLISRISAARPKIADYPFTTLEPNLGVAVMGKEPEQRSFVVADIPGLIEGAHQGAGLGTQFLRHIERTRLLAHLVDVSDASGRPDPAEDFKVIMGELESFGAGLEEKPMLVVASKMDAANKKKLAALRQFCRRKKLALFPISAVTGEGVEKLKHALGDAVEKVRRREQQEAASERASAVRD